jgi:hypothetical protein
VDEDAGTFFWESTLASACVWMFTNYFAVKILILLFSLLLFVIPANSLDKKIQL